MSEQAEELRARYDECLRSLRDANVPTAELYAAQIIGQRARNAGYRWRALHAALAGVEFQSHIPDTDGEVDCLPLGPAHVAVLADGKVIPQGGYTRIPTEENLPPWKT